MGRAGKAGGFQKPRLEQVARDLVAHFETRISVMEGKAMIVCMSRDICVELLQRSCVARSAGQ
jgi:type I restriction enzyme R subunit